MKLLYHGKTCFKSISVTKLHATLRIHMHHILCLLRKHAHAIYRYFLAVKIEKFQLKNFGFFLNFENITFQTINCGYALEPPRWF